MTNVTKRSGEVADFGLVKITEAIKRALKAIGEDYNNETLELPSLCVTAGFQNKMQDGKTSVGQIQGSVGYVLEQARYTDVTRAYILYRKQREKVRNMKNTVLDYKDVVNSYVKAEDWRVEGDFTVTYSVGGLILSNPDAVTTNYWFFEIHDNEIARACRNADIHTHDLSMLIGYCTGWSLKQLLQEGLGGIPNEITPSPAKHLSILCNQVVNFLDIMQSERAGAQTFSSFNTYLAPFIKADNLSHPEVERCIEAFIYGVNTSSRWGTQAPFSSIMLGWTVLNDITELSAIVGGKEMDLRYKDCEKEMDMINKALIETMIEGDSNGHGSQYPTPTYSITRDFDWSDTENNCLLLETIAKYEIPYLSSYINSDVKPSSMWSMYCRLRLDLRELRREANGLSGSDESTGSVGVATINMPRIAYLSKDAGDFYRHPDHMMDASARSLETKREVVTRLLNNGLYPYTRRYLGSLENHLSTIGLIGMNEVGLNAKWLGSDPIHEETQGFTKDMLNHMRECLSNCQEMYGNLYNLEATPVEPITYRLTKHDRKCYPNIITAGYEGDTPYYANSSHLPVDYTADMFDALDIQDELRTLYTSRTVFHIFPGEKLLDRWAAAKLVHTIAENYELPCYTLSPTYSICKDHGYLIGEYFTYPTCDQEVEVYSRIIGYYRPVKNWNEGKSQEYKDRITYDVASSALKKGVAATTYTAEVSEERKETTSAGVYLFTTKTYPNCRIVQEFLRNMGYQAVDAEENPELTGESGIMQAPTLALVKDGEIQKYVNTSSIRKFAETQ